ncbi:PREDICTED: uncharacterized protein LOC109468232 [Branchiostoma belcheri]|uniref:Uncharacterized protein LOC109468232 n=1 Tax=Branchiostoma belcheri TaxID=7741 RepID=A0A6P4YCA9_BRABE|nr:PREDICTED: uncharacterized protein LOC109468232 [Branchiostoma belcheri]
MADLKLLTVVIMAAALVAAGHRRQEMESSWGAKASDGDVPDEESEGSIMDLFNFFEEMTKMFDAMSPGEEQEGHKTETTSGGEATEEGTGTVDIAVPHQQADNYQNHEEQPGALHRVKRLRQSRFRKEQEMESSWGAKTSDGDVVPDEESEGSIMDLFNFFEEMSKMFDAMSPGEEEEGHKTENTSGGEATEVATGHRRQEMESSWGAKASDGDVPDEESEGSIMDLFNFFEEMSKMFDAMSPGEEKEEHTAETTSGGEATEEGTGTVDDAVPHQPADKYQDHEEQPGALQRVKRLHSRQSQFRKRGVKQWFCGKLVDSSEERPRGKRGVREKLWQMFCIPGPASASSASSSSEEWRPPKHG